MTAEWQNGDTEASDYAILADANAFLIETYAFERREQFEYVTREFTHLTNTREILEGMVQSGLSQAASVTSLASEIAFVDLSLRERLEYVVRWNAYNDLFKDVK